MATTINYGPAPTYVKIASQTLSSSAASVTFSNVPQGYTDLVLKVSYSLTVANSSLFIRLNGDTSTNYSNTRMTGTGSAASSGRGSNSDQARITADATAQALSTRQFVSIDFMDYSSQNKYKTFLTKYSSNGGVEVFTDLWRSTSPITSIQVKGFDGTAIIESGATFTLYGIKAAFAPKATGGDRIVQDGTYWYHTFLSSGTFTPSSSLTNVDYLIIAGGGGGTGYYVNNGYAGAGAGGLRSTVGTTGGGGSLESQISLSSATSYAVTIGAGGTSGGSGGSSGNNSSLSGTGLTTITSLGGGARNTTGGSGGGGSYDPNTYGLGTAGQGYRGGNGFIVGGGDTMGGGGGGAGAVGANATSTAGGNGGAGVQISALSVPTLTGVSGYYAGGGGGAAEAQGRTAGTGGVGGGGNGAVAYSNATNAIPNTGSGGGAAGSGAMGRGGSGLVILRYPI